MAAVSFSIFELNQMDVQRLSKDYKKLPETSETFIDLAMTRLMLQRWA